MNIPEWLTPEQHITAAEALRDQNPFDTAELLASDVDNALNSMIGMTVKEHIAHRKEVLEHWKARADATAHKPEEGIHSTILEEMLSEAGLGGQEVVDNIRSKFPMVGKHGYRDVFPVDEVLEACEPAIGVAELREQQESVRAKAIRAIKSDTSENKDLIWASITAEVAKGYAQEIPAAIVHGAKGGGAEADGAGGFVYFRRFIALQLKTDRPGFVRKPRAIDDGRAARINDAALVYTPIRLPSVDTYTHILQKFAASRNAPAKTVKYDHEEAYRQFRASNEEVVRVIIVEGPDGEMRYFQADRLLFGEKLSVLHYCAVSQLLCRLVRHYLLIPMIGYVDDFCHPAWQDDTEIMADVLSFLRDILKTKFNELKSEEGASILYLGLVISVDMENVSVSISEERRKKLITYLNSHLESRRLTKGDAATLVGRLSFSTTAFYGRFGRTMLNTLYARAHQKNVRADGLLNKDLANSLRWWVKLLSGPDDVWARSIPLNGKSLPTFIVYTDASELGLGALKIDPTGESSYIRLDFETRQDSTGIEYLEGKALLAAIDMFGLGPCNIIIFVDNNNLLGSAVKGRSNAERLNETIHQFWYLAATRKYNVWLERVSSKSNPSDAPSRRTPATRTGCELLQFSTMPSYLTEFQLVRSPQVSYYDDRDHAKGRAPSPK